MSSLLLRRSGDKAFLQIVREPLHLLALRCKEKPPHIQSTCSGLDASTNLREGGLACGVVLSCRHSLPALEYLCMGREESLDNIEQS